MLLLYLLFLLLLDLLNLFPSELPEESTEVILELAHLLVLQKALQPWGICTTIGQQVLDHFLTNCSQIIFWGSSGGPPESGSGIAPEACGPSSDDGSWPPPNSW